MRFHFIGIGGIGMSSLAMFLADEGHEVYGSNYEQNEMTVILENRGIDVFINHNYDNWKNPDYIIRSTAIKDDNPEIKRGIVENKRIIFRMELLKKILRKRESLGITGTDGKTTTTALVSCLLNEYLNTGVFLGGNYNFLPNSNYKHGKDILVSEIDESDGFFATVKPKHAIITNIRFDHLEHYSENKKNLYNSFKMYSKNLSGIVIYNADDENAKEIFVGNGISFGKNNGFYRFYDRKIDKTAQIFKLKRGNENLGEFRINLPGEFNVYNAVASIAFCIEYGMDIDLIKEKIPMLKSVDRRFTIKSTKNSNNNIIIDDYAHTPDEIRCTITAAKEAFPDNKTCIVFQPHRYSRLKRENGNFAKSLSFADEVCVYKLYEAYERIKNDVNEHEIVQGLLEKNVPVIHAEDFFEIDEWINLKRNSVIIFMGAGDIIKASRNYLNRYCSEENDKCGVENVKTMQ